MSASAEPEDIAEVLETVEEAGTGARVAIEEIVEEIGERSFGPLLLVASLILVSPISGIPGVPTLGSLVISLIAVQIAIGRRRLWLPGFIRKRSINRSALDRAVSYIQAPAEWMDRVTRKRLTLLVERPFAILPAGIWSAMVLFAPAFEVLPFFVSIVAGAAALFALALVAKDGLIMIAHFVVLVVAMAAAVAVLT